MASEGARSKLCRSQHITVPELAHPLKMSPGYFVFCLLSNFFQVTVAAKVVSHLPPVSLRIGMLLPQNRSMICAYTNSASAVALAVDRIYQEQLLPPGSNISFVWHFEDCLEAAALGFGYDLLVGDQVDFLFASPCSEEAISVAHLGTYFNRGIGLWGVTFATSLADAQLFPTILSVVPNYKDMAMVTCEVIALFQWTPFAFIYQIQGNSGCESFQNDFGRVVDSRTDCTIAYKDIVGAQSDVEYTVEQIKQKARIVILCFDNSTALRSFALTLYGAGMYTEDYVYILIDSDMSLGDEAPFWADRTMVDNADDNKAAMIGKRTFMVHLDTEAMSGAKFANFSQQVMSRMSSWPFYCSDCNYGESASIYSPFLYDAMYLYGLTMNQVLWSTNSTDRSTLNNGTLLCTQDRVTFDGLTGRVTVAEDGVRESIYAFSLIDMNNTLMPQLQLQDYRGKVNFTYAYNVEDAANTIWKSRSGHRPLAVPVCGFNGQGCPLSVFQEYKGFFIGGIVVVVLIVCLVLGVCVYLVAMRQLDRERQNKLWQVSFADLVKVSAKQSKESMRSLHSRNTANSSSSGNTFSENHRSCKRPNVFTYLGEPVVGHAHSTRVTLDQTDMAELRQMCQLTHDNLNRFIGLCLDAATIMSIWRRCGRGSVQDVIARQSINMDAFFVFSLIRDLVEGLFALHGSFLTCHGTLQSTNCLVDDRWQVKLSDFGLTRLRTLEATSAEDWLWSAPEAIRDSDRRGTKAGDIYSLAIICAEIVNQKPVWQPSETKGNPEEIVYLVKKGGTQPLRPLLQPSMHELNPALLHLIRDCWNENPSERPKVETLRSLLKSMVTGRSTNLMDHVFHILEQYASSLEQEVEERMRELVEEQKKSDLLLYRMLPRQVAEKLKLGQTVEPESFECVTIFFSDVVSFTTLASRSTPLQVVNLLNELYTAVDSVIAEYDVYKVETIGDGYLCVSGLPHRNGNEHGRHIAGMSLAIMEGIGRFTIPHMPGERISLRIGVHTGSCVAGVVGLSMPRFCLFGDTVNTASRMESNGKPNKIHLSADANHFLTHVLGGFVTEPRGEVMIKGKGVMETFWLLGTALQA